MKHLSLLAALAVALMLSTTGARADVSPWDNSYQLEAAGKYADALAALDSVPPNGPDAEFKTLRSAWLYYLQGSYNESIREYRLAIERNSQSLDARLGIILPYFAQKRWREAEQSARTALDFSPNNYIGLLRLTIAQEAEHDWKGMEKSATTLTTVYPSNATAYIYLARAQAWLGNSSQAAAAYSAVLVRYPSDLEAKTYLRKNK